MSLPPEILVTILTKSTAPFTDPGCEVPFTIPVWSTEHLEIRQELLIRNDRYRVVALEEASVQVVKLAKVIPVDEPIWIGLKPTP